MHILHAILLGIIEGLTEFLPISSTGHLILMQRAIGFHDYQGVFTVVVQLGAIAAVIWYYRRDLWQKTLGLVRRQPIAIRFWLILVLGTIPAGVLGLLFERQSDQLMTAPVVATALIVGGVVLWIVDRGAVAASTKLEPAIERISIKQALLVGCAQCIALIPGVSRSGATIVGGLSVGLDRATATAFSFYLSIPVLVLASAFKLVQYGDQIDRIEGGFVTLFVGMFAAFITALLAVSWLLKYIAKHNFQAFAYYRIILGLLILLLLGWL